MPRKKQTDQGPAPTFVTPEIADVLAKAGAKSHFDLNPGMQTELQLRDEEIILLAGPKGTGKSHAARAWMIKGNNDVPFHRRTAVDWSYIYHKNFVGLVIRRNSADLEDWMRRAATMYEPFGAWLDLGSMTIYFPEYDSNMQPIPNTRGATIYSGHMSDANSWQKYLGTEIHRLVFEEVVVIPDEQSVLLLISCVRSAIPGIKAQSVLAFNPLGPGLPWLKRRFYMKAGGGTYPPGETQVHTYYAKQLAKTVTNTAVWLTGTLADNKHINAEVYIASLSQLDEAAKKAYIDGSWEAMSGLYFTKFRPKGPLEDEHTGEKEPPNANHVIKPDYRGLASWMRISYGADWGWNHKAAFVRLHQHELTGQTLVASEFAESKMTTIDFGYEIGRDAKPWLDQGYTITVHLSPDAWMRESEVMSEANRIKAGVAKAVGATRVYLEEDTDEDLFSSVPGGINIKKAYNARIPGWRRLDEGMRWKFNLPESKMWNHEEGQRVLMTHGLEEFHKYMELWESSVERDKHTVLPRLQVFDTCKMVIDGLANAQNDPKNPEDVTKGHWEGADIMDALRYGDMGLRELYNVEPPKAKLYREIEEMKMGGANAAELNFKYRFGMHQLQKSDAPPSFNLTKRPARWRGFSRIS